MIPVRLPAAQLARLDEAAGLNRRSEAIREAIEQWLATLPHR